MLSARSASIRCGFRTRQLIAAMAFAVFSTSASSRMSTRTCVQRRVLPRSTMEGLLRRVAENNDLGSLDLSVAVPFVVDGATVGYTSKELADECARHRDAFERGSSGELRLQQSLEDSKDLQRRTEAVARVTLALKERGLVTGWRNELLPVVESFSSKPVLLIERAAYSLFGIRGYGIHVNGFMRPREEGAEIKLWVARRSPSKSTWPGMLDHIVAGGQPYGLSVEENVLKECGEEAGISPELAATAIPTSAVSYTGVDESGRLKRDSLFCFDIELPHDFQPVPVDGEVQSFELHDLDWVIEKVATGGKEGYKPNCNLVVIDFLIRHGAISADSPLYLDLVSALRGPDCS